MSLTPDNRFFSFMSKLGDFIVLNVIFLFTCIPIVTIGASCCALYSCIKKRLKNEEATVLYDYKKAWKENFIPATTISIVYIIGFVILFFFSRYMANHIENFIFLILYMIVFVVITFSLLYVFPLQTTFVNEPLTIIKNSFLTAIRHFPYTLGLFACTYLPLAITWLFPQIFYYTFAYWVFIGCSLCACCSVLLTEQVFRSYIPDEKEVSPSTRG